MRPITIFITRLTVTKWSWIRFLNKWARGMYRKVNKRAHVCTRQHKHTHLHTQQTAQNGEHNRLKCPNCFKMRNINREAPFKCRHFKLWNDTKTTLSTYHNYNLSWYLSKHSPFTLTVSIMRCHPKKLSRRINRKLFIISFFLFLLSVLWFMFIDLIKLTPFELWMWETNYAVLMLRWNRFWVHFANGRRLRAKKDHFF